jgi:outer membrane receptor for ferrienterochelin and colicin
MILPQFRVKAETTENLSVDAACFVPDLVWGGDFRDTVDRTVGSLNISFNPIGLSTQLYGAFLQDEVTLIPDHLKITLGSKLEHNYFSGFAVQPNVRLLWEIGPKYTVWSAISIAGRLLARPRSMFKDCHGICCGSQEKPAV